ncbi:MAG: 2,3-bisphosphoglycerate-independent phosphoglycerate mutase [Candidatus Chromulinivorax sp.]
MSYNSPTALIVLDGLGISSEKKYNAFYQAKTPHLDNWKQTQHYTTLKASGKFVGLQNNYHGNSEVGHFTLGSGQIIQQTSTHLASDLDYEKLISNTTLTNLLKKLNPTSRIHMLGMASDGNIHSSLSHARSFISALAHHINNKILVHAFLDGRDCPPQSAHKYLNIIEKDLDHFQCGKIASIHGRYYAMDRNNNWDRTEKSFKILTEEQQEIKNYTNYINHSYENGIFDEFIIPTACTQNHTIQPNDGIIFFNFRPDRAIQLTKKLLTIPSVFFITPLLYHETLQTTPLIGQIQAEETLLEILSLYQKTIFTIAETEKYAHITYFFNGHKDIKIPGEKRILIPSLPQNPAQIPTMQAQEITRTVIDSLQKDPCDFYLINYANADMVGHSGNLSATIKAIECLDEELGKLYQEIVINQNGTIYITADHGNAEMMFDQTTNQPCTSHTSNQVPFYALNAKKAQPLVELISLADVAPHILKNMGINVPEHMTGTKLND